MMPSLPLLVAAEGAPTKLLSLGIADLVIVVAYFAMVLGIGLYLKRQTQTGEDFFLAGREMTAWIAGLSFLSANLGSLELMGWAACRLPVRHSGHALVLDRRDPGHAVPRHRDDAVLLHLQDPLGARLSATAVRRSQPRPSPRSRSGS